MLFYWLNWVEKDFMDHVLRQANMFNQSFKKNKLLETTDKDSESSVLMGRLIKMSVSF